MKVKDTRFILFAAALGLLPAYQSIGAQTAEANETDSLQAAEPSVQVAFRKVAQDDLLGGVSVIDMEQVNDKNYTTYSLDNFGQPARLCRRLEWKLFMGHGR